MRRVRENIRPPIKFIMNARGNIARSNCRHGEKTCAAGHQIVRPKNNASDLAFVNGERQISFESVVYKVCS
jgi:hypothetical protein